MRKRSPMPVWLRTLLGQVVLAAAYVGAALPGLQLTLMDSHVSLVWPPSGIALAALWLGGLRLWPGVAAGAGAVILYSGGGPSLAGPVMAGNTLAAVAGVLLLRQVKFDAAIARLRDVWALLLLGAGASTTVAALVGGTALHLARPEVAWDRAVRAWWFGDAMGVLVVGWTLLVWASAQRTKLRPWLAVEAALLVGLLAAVSQFVFGAWLGEWAGNNPLETLVIPLGLWATLRFGQRGASTAVLIVVLVAVLGTAQGHGPFARPSVMQSLALLWVFIVAIALAAMVLAAALGERDSRQEALRASQALYRRVVETAEEGVWILDAHSRTQFVNQRVADMLGYTAQEMAGRSLYEFMAPADREQARQDVQRRRQGLREQHDFRFQRRDGSDVWAMVSASPILSKEGRYEGALGMITDITPRKRDEEALRQAHELMDATIQAAPLAIVGLDERGLVQNWNPAAERIFGWKRQEVLGRAVPFVLPDQRAEFDRLFNDVMRGQSLLGVNVCRQRRDGTPVDLRLYAAPLRSAQGTVNGVITLIDDVTASLQAHQALVESERRLATLMASLPGMAFRCRNDANWTMLFVSRGSTELTGYQPRDLMHNTPAAYGTLIHPDDRQRVWQTVQESLSRRSGYHVSYRIHTAGGDTKWVWEQGTGVWETDGRLVAIEGFIIDVTQRVEAEQALRAGEERYRELAERLRMLLRELDHRVKNNLAGLFALVDMYARTATDAQELAVAIRGKLAAMTVVHAIIADAGWRAVDLRTLLEKLAVQLVPGRGAAPPDSPPAAWELTLDGSAILVAPRQAGPLAMVIQELFANCAKHGTYCDAAGKVTLTWQVLASDPQCVHTRLLWQESGGPPVTPAASRGQGLQLIEGFCRFELAGTCRFSFPPQGFCCELDCRLDAPPGHPGSDIDAPADTPSDRRSIAGTDYGGS